MSRPLVLVPAMVAAVAALAALAACSAPVADEPPDTVGALPVVTDITTIVPIVVDTEPPEVGTAPPGSLFGGDPCSALDAGDFARVTIASAGSGELVDRFPVTVDACQFVVEAGGDQYDVIVAARTASDFEAPAASDSEVADVSGVGLAARRIDRGDRVEVVGQVENGWFAVIAPDATSATFLARQAARRAG